MLTEDDLAKFFETHDFDGNEPDNDLTINIIRAVTDYIEKKFGTYTRGKKHSVPKNAQDVQKLYDLYNASAYHTFTRGRKMTEPKITH